MTPAQAPRSRVAVIGHVEHVEFADVERVPAAGEIAHAGAAWSIAAGGGAVAAAQLAKLAGACDFFTVLGDDELGRRCLAEVEAQGVSVHAVFEGAQRRAITLVEPAGERTIITVGPKLRPRRSHRLPWAQLADCDAVFFVSGDEAALAAARAAGVVCATTRELETLRAAGIRLDAVIGSARDPGERYEPIEPSPGLVVLTAGAAGGSYALADGRRGAWPAARPPGPIVDAYGAGDSFAAALTFALGRGDELDDALALAARAGAACLTGHGPYEGQLRLESALLDR